MSTLERARAEYARRTFTDTAQAETSSITSDGGGGAVRAPTLGAPFPCLLRVASGSAQTTAFGVAERGSYTLETALAVDLAAEAVVVVAGRRLRVVWRPPVTERAVYRTYGLAEVRGNAE